MRKVVSRAAVSAATRRAEVLTAQRIVVFFGIFLFFSRASKRAVSTAPARKLVPFLASLGKLTSPTRRVKFSARGGEMKSINLLASLFYASISIAAVHANASIVQTSKVVMGDEFACASRADGKISCWGNAKGVINATPNLQNVTDLSAYWHHACAVASGKVVCWGDNSYGQLGVPADLTNAVSVSVSDTSSCAASSSHVRCWGSMAVGGHMQPFDITDPFGAVNGIQKMEMEESSVGYHHICILASQQVQCWSKSNQSDITPPANLGAVSDIKLGARFACGMTTGGWKCWGDSRFYKDVLQYSDEYQISAFDYKYFRDERMCFVGEGGISCWNAFNNPSGYIGVQSVAVGSTDWASAKSDGCATTAEGVRCWGPTYTNSQAAVPMPTELQSLNDHMNVGNLDGFLGCYAWMDGRTPKVAKLNKVTSAYEFDSTGKPVQMIELSGGVIIAEALYDDVIKSPSMDELYVSSKTPTFDKNGKPMKMTHAIRVYKRRDGTFSILSPYGHIWGLTKTTCY